ncbi:hypothetical protein M885DRAFT_535119 [Pelagophyceae sp. CCMP2097]|nr:hypothetical protein M885DRAFT_535119 [Pelagophyceae sp. CCMP2097]
MLKFMLRIAVLASLARLGADGAATPLPDEVRTELRALGYRVRDIDGMKKSVAHVVIRKRLPRPRQGMPDSWRKPVAAKPKAAARPPSDAAGALKRNVVAPLGKAIKAAFGLAWRIAVPCVTYVAIRRVPSAVQTIAAKLPQVPSRPEAPRAPRPPRPPTALRPKQQKRAPPEKVPPRQPEAVEDRRAAAPEAPPPRAAPAPPPRSAAAPASPSPRSAAAPEPPPPEPARAPEPPAEEEELLFDGPNDPKLRRKGRW